jgi:S1-C subfamily serine protease
MEPKQIESKRPHRYVYVLLVALLLVAAFGGGVMMGGTMPNVLWASAERQDAPALREAVLSAQQVELEGVLPTQELLSTLYDHVAPSVVNIQVTTSAQAIIPFPGLPFGDDIPSQPARGQGSGFIYDMEGHIVTNNHVVEDAEEIIVNFGNGMWARAELVASDPQADLAVIKVTPPEGMEWRPLTLAGDNNLRPGYYVVALGSPFGLSETMTVGVVSALGRSFPTGNATTGNYSLPDVIQTDTAINPGNSGGPLLNLMGEVVGVNFAINSISGSNSGVGFAIPVSVVRRVVPALIEEGAYHYSYLGIAGQTITALVAEERGLDENTLGVIVGEVVAGGPAARAGIRADDIIIGIDDQTVKKFEDLISYPGAQQAQRGGDEDTTISISEALNIAREAVEEAGLMTSIDNASAKRDTVNGTPVWSVSLTGGGRSATVIVDANTGEVLELNVQ